MMPPTIFYMFLNAFGTLVIGDMHITTLVFKEPIGKVHTGVSKSQVFIDKSPDRKMLFLKSLGSHIDTNLTVPTKSGKLYSFRLIRGKRPHSLARIEDGLSDKAFKMVFSKNNIFIEEGKYSLKVTNKNKKEILINSMNVEAGQEISLPKGPSVFVDGVRFYK